MAKGRWIGIDEYYHELGYEDYGDDWDESYITQLIADPKRDRKSEAFKKANEVRRIFYNRIWDDIEDIQVMYRDEQGYAPAIFTIEGWFIEKSECLDAEGYARKCQVFLSETETRGRKPLNDEVRDLIFSCTREIYPDADEYTETIDVTAVHAHVVEKTQDLNEKRSVKIKAPSYGAVRNYIRQRYPASRKKTRNFKN